MDTVGYANGVHLLTTCAVYSNGVPCYVLWGMKLEENGKGKRLRLWVRGKEKGVGIKGEGPS